MRSTFVLVAAAALGAACSSSTDVNTKLAHGIISGQNQTAVAGATQLSKAVIEVMVRNSTGTLSLHRVEPRSERLLDLLVPRAYAQGTGTVVTGSPVPGAVVCAAGGDGGLVPFVQCTNTDTAGHATFFFTPSNKAGQHTSEIRGTVNAEPAVFDTAKATVTPAAADSNFRTGPFATVGSPDTLPAATVIDKYSNAVAFRVVSDSHITASDTTAGAIGARVISWQPSASDGNGAQLIAELRGTGGAVIGHMRYTIGVDHLIRVESVAGVNLTP